MTGRGIALCFVIANLLVTIVALLAFRTRAYRAEPFRKHRRGASKTPAVSLTVPAHQMGGPPQSRILVAGLLQPINNIINQRIGRADEIAILMVKDIYGLIGYLIVGCDLEAREIPATVV